MDVNLNNKEKTKKWERRVYFVQNHSEEIVVSGLMDEEQCQDYIRHNGDYNMPYLIGYTVMSRVPIIKAINTAHK